MSAETTLAKGIQQLHARVEEENKHKSAQTITIDGTNIVEFPGFPYKFEALGEKILVSIDIFKSGYECRTCMGAKKIETKCVCEESDRPGYKYSQTMLDAFGTMGDGQNNARTEIKCSECGGDYLSKRDSSVCPECKGLGALLVIPDTSKNLPTTGVVVSMGSACDHSKLGYKLGDRILFGPYTGNMIPTKAGLMLKTMDATAAMARIDGGEELAAFDFVIQSE